MRAPYTSPYLGSEASYSVLQQHLKSCKTENCQAAEAAAESLRMWENYLYLGKNVLDLLQLNILLLFFSSSSFKHQQNPICGKITSSHMSLRFFKPSWNLLDKALLHDFPWTLTVPAWVRQPQLKPVLYLEGCWHPSCLFLGGKEN